MSEKSVSWHSETTPWCTQPYKIQIFVSEQFYTRIIIIFFLSPEKAKKSLSQRDDQIKSQKDEIKQLKHKLTVQEKITNSSESSNKKYLSALVHSQGLIKSLVTTVTTALGDMADIADGEEDDKKSVKKEETTE